MPAQPKCLTSWSPPAGSTLPTGLAHHGNDQKAAILLWSSHSLCTQIIRGCRSAMRDNLPPAKTHLLQLPHGEDEEVHIRQVLSGSQDTCVLCSDGRLFTCETSPSRLQLVPSALLGSVRTACVTRCGGFALICSSPDDNHSLSVQLLPADVGAAIADNRLRHRYDISFAANELQSSWHSTRFRCKDFVQSPSEQSGQFVRLLRGQSAEPVAANDSFQLLGINNQLFALICEPEEAIGAFHLVHTFGADIREFWISAGADAVFVLLDSGYLETLHGCALLDNRRLQCSQLALGDQVLTADIWPDDQLVYSTGWQLIQLQLRLNPASDQYQAAERREICLCGAIAVTHVPEAAAFLVLTENGFIYHWPQADSDADGEDSRYSAEASRLQQVDDHFVQRGQQQLDHLLRLTRDYEALQADIGRLRVQRRVLQLAAQRKSDAACPLRARLQATKSAPVAPGPNTLYAGPRGQQLTVGPNTFFVSIELQRAAAPPPHHEWPLAAAEMWTLCIRETHPFGAHSIVRTVRVAGAMFARPEPVQIVLSTECPERCLRLPAFSVQLLAFVRSGEDFLVLAFDVPGDGLEQRELWHCWPVRGGPPFVYDDLWLGRGTTPPAETEKGLLEYRIRLPAEFSWPEVLGILCDSSPAIADGGEQGVYVCALDRWVRMRMRADADEDETQVLSLAAPDAGALYEVKACLLAELWRRCGGADGEVPAPGGDLHREIVYTEEMAKEASQEGEGTEHLQQLLQRLTKVRETGADFSRQRDQQT